MKTEILEVKCCLCDFKITREIKTNGFGYFEIPDAYCPNDLLLLTQNLDHREKE